MPFTPNSGNLDKHFQYVVKDKKNVSLQNHTIPQNQDGKTYQIKIEF